MTFSRRTFLGATGAAGVVAVAGGSRLLGESAAAALPDPATSGIEHIVVVMMENRSFDHFLGWVPGANGKQAGLRYTDRYGVSHPTHHLTSPGGCGFEDPDHSYEGGRIQYNFAHCDGFLKSGENDQLAIGYYTKDDLAFLGPAVADWTVLDHYFSATMAETYPNRFYQHSAQTDRMHNSYALCTLPTIWDRLAGAGVSGTYYYSDVPFTALWGQKHLDISQPFADFLTAAASGTLPAVSFVDPAFSGEGQGTSGDDHPLADIRSGEGFMNQVYDAVRNGPGWANTVLVINYDEWGGFFDHVPPPPAPDNNPKFALRGFRTPAMVISPFAKPGHVGTSIYDHTSVLKMIEWRHGLAPLTKRDAAARNLAEVLDFSLHRTTTPTYIAPPYVSPGCTTPAAPAAPGTANPDERNEWTALADLARRNGFQVIS